MNNFDVIYYINLDERIDRKLHILKQLKDQGVNMNKVYKIQAIKHEKPYIGCILSHQKCMEDFEKKPDCKNCLILEDDFTFKRDKNDVNEVLNRFFSQNIKWDILMMSAFERKIEISSIPFLIKAHDVQTASGYAINRDFLKILKNNLDSSVLLLKETNDMKYCADQYWKHFQPHTNWYIIYPKIGCQIDNFSNIENKIVNYLDKYDVNKPDYRYKCIMGVMTCKANLHLAKEQQEKYFTNIQKYPILYIKFWGNPNLETDWLYDELNNTLIIKCEDDYVNLPNKVYLFLKIIKTLFPHMPVFKTDDDIQINIDELYNILIDNATEQYYGVYAGYQECKSSYLFGKTHVTDKYPELKKIEVHTPQGSYVAGGGYFLNLEALNIILANPNNFRSFPENFLDYYDDKENCIKGINIFEDKTIGYTLFQNGIIPVNKKNELMKAVRWENM